LLLLLPGLLQWGYASLADAVQAWYDEVRRKCEQLDKLNEALQHAHMFQPHS
jgi:hypothetical protein